MFNAYRSDHIGDILDSTTCDYDSPLAGFAGVRAWAGYLTTTNGRREGYDRPMRHNGHEPIGMWSLGHSIVA